MQEVQEVQRSYRTPQTEHGCWDGYHWIGFGVEDENGEQGEAWNRVLCRRCHGRESA
jgi:hypothetical protein